MTNKQRILWITRTAIFIALLVAVQWVTKPLGQYVTGSLVNLILILSVMLAGVAAGVTVAVLSPALAFLLGIGPALIQLVPFIMLGNVAIVLVWHFIAGKGAEGKSLVRNVIAAAAGAGVKFLVLFLTIAKFAVPVLLKLPEPQATMISTMFSVPQLITAAIGGAVAVVVVPLLKKIIK